MDLARQAYSRELKVAVLVIEAIRNIGRPVVPRETITLRADAPA